MKADLFSLFETSHPAARTAPVLTDPNARRFTPRTVEQAIQDAADAIDDAALKSLSADAAQPFAQARALLGLLARCYARQIYSSLAAARLAASEPDFPWLWWETLPDAAALRRFRAENQAAIHRCLVAALRFEQEQKIFAGALTRVNAPQLAEEASRRIVMGAFADSMELEGE